MSIFHFQILLLGLWSQSLHKHGRVGREMPFRGRSLLRALPYAAGWEGTGVFQWQGRGVKRYLLAWVPSPDVWDIWGEPSSMTSGKVHSEAEPGTSDSRSDFLALQCSVSSPSASVSLVTCPILPPLLLPVFHLPFLLHISLFFLSSSSLSFLFSFLSRGRRPAKMQQDS